MNPYLVRMVALVLVPALIADPVTAAAWSVHPERPGHEFKPLARITEQAVVPYLLSPLHPRLQTGRASFEALRKVPPPSSGSKRVTQHTFLKSQASLLEDIWRELDADF